MSNTARLLRDAARLGDVDKVNELLEQAGTFPYIMMLVMLGTYKRGSIKFQGRPKHS